MKDLQNITAAFEQARQRGEKTVLATVVETAGSVYRCTGARMLILESGEFIGTISGGCLEEDVCEQAQGVMQSGPAVVVYDSRPEQDLLWGLGSGCNGFVKVLIEPLAVNRPNPLSFIAECIQQQQTGLLATVYQADHIQTPIGSHLMLGADGRVEHTLQDAALVEQMMQDAPIALRFQQSITQKYAVSQGSAVVRLEVIQPPPTLILFGAGQDVVPVVQFAKALGWHVTVVDRSAAKATPASFPLADHVMVIRPEQIMNHLHFNPRTAVVLMTHRYFDDQELLKTLLPLPVCYLGLLGPRHRTQRLLAELESEDVKLSSSPSTFYTPIGLDIGAETPEEIALAIVAEIQAVLTQRTGGMLRNRKAPIHTRMEENECLPLAQSF